MTTACLLLALVLSGTAQVLVSPPLGWAWLQLGVWVPAFYVFSRLDGWRSLLAGWLVGVTAGIALFYWLPATTMRYGGLGLVPAALVWGLHAATTGFYVAVFAWGFGSARRAGGVYWPFVAAAWFCALEFLNPQVFPYSQGSFWYEMPHVFLVSALTGVSGVTFLVIAANAVLFQAIEGCMRSGSTTHRAWIGNAIILVCLVASSCLYSRARLAQIASAEQGATPLRVAVVQPNHTIERRRELRTQGEEAFARDMTAQSRDVLAKADAAREPVDVLVWPEGALREDPAHERNRAVRELAREAGVEVWTGAPHREPATGGAEISHNSAFRIFASGAIDRRYDKNILVPFGEYVPLRDVIPGFERIPAVADFEAGRGVPTYGIGTARFVFLICYEAILSSFVRSAIGEDVNLLVNVTVDAWYGDTSEQSQHLMLAAVQSAMNGIPLIRATSTGISAIVDARGVITARTGVFVRDAIVTSVYPIRVPGPYSRWGEWFAWSCVVVGVGLVLFPSARGARSRPTDPSP